MNRFESDRQRDTSAVIQARDNGDAVDVALFGMIIVLTDNLIFIGIRLLDNTVVHDHDAFFAFPLTNVRLDNPLQIG